MLTDILPALFLLVVVLLGGVVAVLADNAGRRLGKKRHTLFGLRPRHTATLMTVVLGMGVSALTIGLVYAASSDVRTWIREGARAVAARDRALGDLRKANARLESAREESGRLKTTNASLQADAVRGRAEATRLDADLRARKDEIARLQPVLAGLRREVGGLRTEVAGGRRRIAELRGQLATARGLLASTGVLLRAQRANLGTLRAEVGRIQATRKEAVRQSNEANEENLRLTRENARQEGLAKAAEAAVVTLRDQARVLEDARRTALAELTRVQGLLTDRQADLDKTELGLARARVALAEAGTRERDLTSTFGRTRRNPLTFRAGEPVARVAVPAGLSANAARGLVNDLLKRAREAAGTRGARSVGQFEAAGVVDEIDARGVTRRAEAIRTSFALSLAGRPARGLATASSVLNAFEGEPVSVALTMRDNPMVYRGGETVAEGTFDGRRPAGTLLDDLNRWFAGEVRRRAESAGMRPGEDDLGQVTSDRLVQLVDEIRSARGPVVARAVAEGPAGAAEPLRLRFSVTPASP